MKKAFSVFFLMFAATVLSAQEGIPILTNYEASREIENQSWAISQDGNKVMLFANRKGTLSFDGVEWATLRIPVLPYSLKYNPSDSRVYYGGENDFGYLEKSQVGTYVYNSLAGDSSDVGQVTKIIFSDSLIWFYSEKALIRYNAAANRKELQLNSTPGMPFTGVFVIGNNTFVNVSGKGLHKIENDTLLATASGNLTGRTDILFSLPYDGRMVLLGFSDGRLMLFDGRKYYPYQVGDEGYLKTNLLSDGITLGDSLYAFSTFDGGAVVMERKSGRVKYTINNQNGLPDDEIFAIGSDCSGGLWLSHQFGLTRADLNLPVSNFSIYPGLKGNITSSLRYNNELYVSTSEGVFYLVEIKNYTEVEVLKKGESGKKIAPPQVQSSGTELKEKTSDTQTRRKGIFNKIFRKKNNSEERTGANQRESEITPNIPITAPAVQFSWQKVSKLKSVNYVYRKVNGLDEKCRQLVPTPGGMLAATNRGLFLIKDHMARVLAGQRYINFISWQPFEGKYSVATGSGYLLLSLKNNNWIIDVPDPSFTEPLYSVVQNEKDILWLGGDDIAWKANLSKETGKITYESFRIENNFPQPYFMNLINDSVFLMTETGMNFYDVRGNGFLPYKTGSVTDENENSFIYPLSNIPLVKHGYEWILTEKEKPISDKETAILKLFDDIISVNIESDNVWIVDGGNNLLRINRKKSSGITPATDLFVKNIQNENGNDFDLSNVVFHRGDNVINFKIVAPAFYKKNLTRYQYKISKIMSDWTPWATETSYSMGISRSGEYTLYVRAKDLWGNIGEPVSITFTMRAPFTRTTLFYVLLIIAASMLMLLVVRVRENRLKEMNRVLEEKVRERTAEIEAQKEEITSSIEYASRIQMAMLPVNDLFKASFPDHFIIYKPRDIVSGDFYWIGEDDKNIYIAVGDCTGHGVPGAFMSALGISTLNEIITNNNDIQANTVLNLLREKIKRSLHQTGKEGEAADGMDISFVIFRKYRKRIQFAGAYNSLLVGSGGELIEYKADRMPIGIHYRMEAPFTNYEISIKKGDSVYMLTDGLCDQFGGPDGCKYKKANLKRYLSQISDKSMADQKGFIENEYEKWRGHAEQVDDITMIGIKI